MMLPKTRFRSVCGLITVMALMEILGHGCRAGREHLLIGAASSFYDVLHALDPDLATVAGIPIDYTFDSTGILEKQLEAGAPMDLLLSAGTVDNHDPAEGPCIVAYGRLILWTPPEHHRAIHDLGELERPEFRRIAVGDARYAPYGRAALAALDAQGVTERLRPKILVVASARRVFLYVRDGQVDAGFTALSLVQATGHDGYIVPPHLYPPIRQFAMVPRSTRHPRSARKVLRFLCGPTPQYVLERHGFFIPDRDDP